MKAGAGSFAAGRRPSRAIGDIIPVAGDFCPGLGVSSGHGSAKQKVGEPRKCPFSSLRSLFVFECVLGVFWRALFWCV